MSVNNGVASGTVLAVNAATIAGLNSSLVTESARATAMTRVATTPPLVIAVDSTRTRCAPANRYHVFTVSNRGAVPLTGVVLQARVPHPWPASAPPTRRVAKFIAVFNDGLCNSSELMNWNIGTLPAGSGTTVSVAAQVSRFRPRRLLTRTFATEIDQQA